MISINPRNALGWLGRGSVLMQRKNVREALEASEFALALERKSVKALTQIGQCHALLGDTEAAVSYFDRALAIKPDDDVALQNRIFSLDFGSGDYALHQAARSEWWRRIASSIPADHPAHHENSRDPARRIVLGYVSADFRSHSAARIFRPVLENHDKSRFEVICYSNSPTQDEVTELSGISPIGGGTLCNGPTIGWRIVSGPTRSIFWWTSPGIQSTIASASSPASRSDTGNRMGAWQRHRYAGHGLPVHRSGQRPPRKYAVCSRNKSITCRARSSSNRRPRSYAPLSHP